MNKSRSGFTIVELLIVIVVIGILAAITIVAYNGVQNNAYDSTIKADLRNMGVKFEAYRANNGQYPANGQLIDADIRASKSAYQTTTNALLYCAVVDPNNGKFSIGAMSRSGKAFLYTSTVGAVASTTSWSGDISRDVLCPQFGITVSDPKFADGWGFNVSGAWRPWVQG